MKNILLFYLVLSLIGCSKSAEKLEDLNRELTVKVVAVRITSPYISNNWEVWLNLNSSANMNGNIIVQHDLWDLGQYKATYIDTFDYKFENHIFYSFRTKRNANYQGPEIKNIKVNKFIQSGSDYTVTIK